MPYRIRFHRAAKDELEKCRPLYAPKVFWDKVQRWLKLLSTEAENRQWTLSTDLESLFGGLDEVEQLVKQWPTTRRRFWDAGFRAKLKAAYLVITGRVPYQARSAIETSQIEVRP